MRNSISILVVLCIIAPACTVTDDHEVLREFKTVLWPQAYRTQDAELLDRLLHDSFEMIDADGNRSTKQQELEYIRNNEWDPGSFEYRIERLQIYQGSFAVIDGTGVAENYTYQSSNFLVKEDGAWRAIASHVSGVQSTNKPESGTPATTVERYYCTQFGPFFFRFDPDKAAGVFAILANDDLGAVVGTIEGRTFSGTWHEIDSSGDITVEFSDDWTSFDAAYTVDDEPGVWRRGWLGRLRPEAAPTSFEDGEVTFRCNL